MSKTVLITGITGFIGLALANRLKEKGYNVIGLSLSNKNIAFECFKIDILNVLELKKVPNEIDIIVHLAAMTSNKEISDNLLHNLKTNLLGTYNLLEFFEKSKAKTFFYASSGKVYGKPVFLPFTEEHPLNPQNALGKSKKITEDLIRVFSTVSRKNFVIFRMSNIYGATQKSSFLIPTILNQLNKKIILGNIDTKRDYLYIEDLIDAFVTMLETDIKGMNTFNVASSNSYSAQDIVDLLSKIIGNKLVIDVDKRKLRADESPIESVDISKIKSLGWLPKTQLEDGLRKTLEQFRSRE